MQLKITSCRLSFPSLFVPKVVTEGSEPKYSASILLDKQTDATQIAKIKDAMDAVTREKWGNKIPASLKKCLHDGAEKDYDGYGPDMVFLSTSATVRPTVVNKDMSPLTAQDGKPYAGSYCHFAVRFWAQDNQFGKRVNCQLQGVQFAAEGEAFGSAPFDASSVFTSEDGESLGFSAEAEPPRPAQRQPVPVSGPVSNKKILKQKFKQHPLFINGTMTASAVNGYMVKRWGAKLEELQEDAAQEAIDCFDQIVDACSDDLDF